MNAVDELITWLRAQLDDDERVARVATAGPWRHNPEMQWRKPGTTWFEEAVFAGPFGKDAICIAGTGEPDDAQSMDDANHIARWDPARVLAEIEAKRRILDKHARVLEGDNWAWFAGSESESEWYVRILALPYAGREGWREEWRPAT